MMAMRILSGCQIVVAVLALGIPPASAATSCEGTIVAANVDTFSPRLTVKKSDGVATSIFLDSGTAVTVDGRSAHARDLKVGQQVQATGKVSSYTGQLEATAITATTPAPPTASSASATPAEAPTTTSSPTPTPPTGPRVLKSFSSSDKPAPAETPPAADSSAKP